MRNHHAGKPQTNGNIQGSAHSDGIGENIYTMTQGTYLTASDGQVSSTMDNHAGTAIS